MAKPKGFGNQSQSKKDNSIKWKEFSQCSNQSSTPQKTFVEELIEDGWKEEFAVHWVLALLVHPVILVDYAHEGGTAILGFESQSAVLKQFPSYTIYDSLDVDFGLYRMNFIHDGSGLLKVSMVAKSNVKDSLYWILGSDMLKVEPIKPGV